MKLFKIFSFIIAAVLLIGTLSLKKDNSKFLFSPPVPDSLTFIIIQGESNASGQALNSQAPAAQIGNRPSVQITHNGTGSVVKFENLNIGTAPPGNNQLLAFDGTAKFGFELPLANQVDSGLLANPVYVCKQGFPGSVISDWLPGGARNAQFIESLDSAFAQMNRKGTPYRIFVWQTIGINDIGTGGAGPTPLDSFAARMGRLRSYYRTRYSRPDIQFLTTRFSNATAFSGGFNFPGAATIDGMRTVDSKFHSIPCDGATYVSGQSPVHWDYFGMGTIAHNMLDTMLNLMPSSGPTTTLSFSQISTSTDVPGYERGAEEWIHRQWNNAAGQGVNMPAGNSTFPATNFYTRFLWGTDGSTGVLHIEGSTAGSYTFTDFDNEMHRAIDNHMIFSFRVMPVCDQCGGTVPAYVQTLIEANSNVNLRGYFGADGMYVPNWNNPDFLLRYRAMLVAVANHIATTSYQPSWSTVAIPYSKVVYQVDIGGYGNFGEWHQFPWVQDAGFPSRIIPTATSLDSLINMNLNVFPNYQAEGLIAAFGAGSGTAGTQFEPPTEVGYRLLTSSNNVGQIGWRRDNWGDPQYVANLENNSRSYNPGTGAVAFAPLIMNKYKFAPVTGEPLNGRSDNNVDMLPEIQRYHGAGIGNGNLANANVTATQTNYQNAMLVAGYRIILTGGSMTTNLASNSAFNITLNWQNIGLAPPYGNWNVTYELRTLSGTVVWSGTSGMILKLFLPLVSPTVQSDNFVLPTITAGTYNMYLKITDPQGYRVPFSLAITGRGSDGAYLIRSNVSVGSTSNIPPTAAISGSGNIQLPTNSVLLSGTGSTDPDGSIASYSWTQVSGPNTATRNTPTASTCTMGGLIAGTYVFNLTVTDNAGATGSTTKTVVVANANVPPTAAISGSGSITLPTNSVALSGTGSTDPDGTITAYSWTFVSGPNTPTIGTPTASTSTISGMIAGTYVIRLTVTDNNSATGTTTKTINVNNSNTPPTAVITGAGNITLPTNSVALSGTGSSDPDGTIAAYAWSQVSGPNTATVGTPTASTSTMSGLIAGTYVFQLIVTDNLGASGNTQKTVIVSNSSNVPPTAVITGNGNITLPTNSVALSGTGSSDPDGTIASYAWTQVSGPNTATIGTSTSSTSTVSGLIAGTYVFRLTVTDNLGSTGSTTKTIIVNPANVSPTAVITGSNIVNEPTTSVSLVGTGSFDQDGSITTYAWTQVSGPNTGSITTPSASNTTVTGLILGTYVFQLVVTDNLGATGTSQKTVTVVASPINIFGSTAPASTTTENDGQGLELGVKFRTTVAGLITGIRFYKTVGNSGTHIGELYSGSGSTLGVRLAQATFTGETASGWQTVTFSSPISVVANTTYVAAYHSPGGGYISTVHMLDTAITNSPLTALASGTDGVNGVYVYSSTPAYPTSTFQNSNYWVDVLFSTPVVPTASAGPDQILLSPTSSATMAGSGTGNGGATISSYLWTKVSGGSNYNITTPSSATTTITGLTTGVYVFNLLVTDNNGQTASDNVTITVRTPPTADAGPDQSITLPINSVTMNGAGQAQGSASIVSFLWTKISGPSSFVITDSSIVNTTVTGLTAGNYTFRLLVTDSDGNTDIDDVIINVILQTDCKCFICDHCSFR